MHPAIAHIATPVIAALIMNAIIYLKGWTSSQSQSQLITRSPLLPPGPVIGTVWIFIFAALGYAHYLISNTKPANPLASTAIIAIIIWCLLYPILTSGLKETRAKLLNTISLILAAILCTIVAQATATANRTKALYFTLPLLAWSSYVNISDAMVCSKAPV